MKWLGKIVVQKLIDALIDLLLNLVETWKEKATLKRKVKEANSNDDRQQASQKLQDLVDGK